MEKLTDEMQASILRWIKAAWRSNTPATVAMDRTPVETLQAAFNGLRDRWLKAFSQAAPGMAETFVKGQAKHVDTAMKAAFRDAGMTVRFQASPAALDLLQASIAENVALIRSIPEQHLAAVEGSVFRAVTAGRDLYSLSQDLQHVFGVTKRRAAKIALDQANKASAVLTRQKQLECGITHAKWLHSHAGKVPRPSHVAFDKKIYEVEKGAFLDGEWIWPGQLINCRCGSRGLLPGRTS